MYDFEFALNFAQYNCDNLYQKFQQLWNVPAHSILLIATRQGSVIATFFIQDSTDGSTVTARFNQLVADLAIPGSPSNTFANSNGIPVVRASVATPTSPLIFIIIGAVIGGIVLCVGVVLLIIFLRRRHRYSDTKYTVTRFSFLCYCCCCV
jgi:uncharacterized integral membrane protein